MKVLAVVSIKGGVGKTSAAVNLADAAAAAGARCVVWDLDPQGAATWSLGVGHRIPGGGRRLGRPGHGVASGISATAVPGIDVLPADFSLRHLDIELAQSGHPKRRVRNLLCQFDDSYDAVFVDCPPGITLAIEATMHAADAVVVPVMPAALPMRTAAQLRSFIGGEKGLRSVAVLPFLSMIDRRRSTHRRLVEELDGDRRELLSTPVPLSVDVEAMGVHRSPVSQYAPRSPAVQAYRSLWSEIDGLTANGASSSEASEPSKS